jgi:hypothetical protein
LIAAVVVLPYQFGSAAPKKGLITRTSSQEPGLENYDIRTDLKSEAVQEYFASTRDSLGRNAAVVSDIREGFARGEAELKARLPQVKFEYNEDIRIPEVITPDVWYQKIEYLSSPSTAKRSEILRNFLKENNSLVGVTDQQANDLVVTADYTNPNGYLSFAHLEQRINDIPVFRGEVKAGFTKDGQIIRVINNLAPGLSYDSLSTNFGDPLVALKKAAGYINRKDVQSAEIKQNDAVSTNLKAVFGDGDFANTAEKMYFPTEPGVAVPAWRVLIWGPVSSYYVIVDAQTGTMLWRKNLTEDQTQAATYNVYANANNLIGSADNPFPLSPGPLNPTLGTQGAAISRTSITRVGNEAPYTFNNNGWITDGNNTTDGNNVQAGLDRKLPNTGSPANPNDVDPDGMATGNPNRTFNFPINPGNPNTNTGDNPIPSGAPGTCLAQADATLPTDYQKAAVTNLFFVVNRYHDELYRLGFTEQAFNFQHDNFGRGGLGNDRVSAQAQDCSGSNNANFTTPADGSRPTMQMYLWTGPTPDFDGDLDAEVIIHEHTHGLSNRLHGNSAGLSTNMARGMGEGWGDFFGYTMLAEPGDPIDGVYTTGGYATYLIDVGFTANYYYGIRRFPRAPITFLGPNGKPHNPFTFRYLNAGCDTLIGTPTSNPAPNSAYPRGPVGTTGSCDQVHNAGEIWSSALWEVRNRMVNRLGFATGTTRVLQVVVDGMKLAPLAPTPLTERDAIIAAASAFPIAPEAAADVADVRDGFRVRGMGFTSSIQGTSPAAVTEAFDNANVIAVNPITLSDSTGDNDGTPEAGEPVLISVPVNNTTGATVNSVQVSINGGAPVNYGNIAHNATVTQQIPVTIDVACGAVFNASIVVSSAIGSQPPVVKTYQTGTPLGGLTENFDGVTAPALPAGWTTSNSGASAPALWATRTTTPASAPNEVFTTDPATNGDSILLSPTFNITSSSAKIKFKIDHLTEDTWDGAVLEVKIGAGTFQDITAAGGSIPVYPYTDTLGNFSTCVTNGTTNPLATRQAWSGNSGGYKDVEANLPASANGQTVQFRIRMGSDCSVSSTGVSIDDVQVVSGYSCNYNTVAVRSRADFDGDGRSDLSVYRPSEGNWYLNQTQAGFGVVRWGLNTDTVTPGDYDGDGKTDFAIFRPNPDASQPDFYVLNSNGFTVSGISWGIVGDKPVIADYDGDDKADIGVWRESELRFYIWKSSGGVIVKPFGLAGDVPVAGNFVGDAKADITLFRPSTNQWWIFNGVNDTVVTFGQAGDVLVPADYNGDNVDDVAVFRPATGQWVYLPSGGGAAVFANWGTAGDIPVPGDYDGDGKDDFAVYRNGQWWLNRSLSGPAVANFGLSSDKAIPRQYLP